MKSPYEVSKLCEGIRKSRLMLRAAREERREMVRQGAGRHWGEEGTNERVPVNLISLYQKIVIRSLIAKNPRVLLTTFRTPFRPVVHAMQDYVNNSIERMNLSETLERIAYDSLYSIGIGKVSLAAPSDAATASWNIKAGEAVASRVDLDDFVFDPHARDFQSASWIGHRYRAPLDVIRSDQSFSRHRKELTASLDEPYNQEGDERIRMLGAGYVAGMGDELEDHVDLWEIYLPRHRLIITLPDSYLSGSPPAEPLREQRWIGPECGPYYPLCMGIVPGSAMPKAPIMDLIDLHEAANRSFRKIVRSIDRIKEMTAVQGGAEEDGNRIINADDGDAIRVDNPQNIQQFVTGGSALQSVLAGAMLFKDTFSYHAGNLDTLGGLSAQAATAHQEELLNQNASSIVAGMQDTFVRMTSKMTSGLCWYWWNDPRKVHEAVYQIPSMPSMQATRSIFPWNGSGNPSDQRGGLYRNTPFSDLMVKVDPYSLPHQSPQQRLASINQVVQQVIIPMMPMMQQQGINFDIHAYLQKVASYMDCPDLSDILTIREVTPSPAGSSGNDSRMAPNTTRTNIRENRSTATREASDRNLMTSALGVDTGGAQKNGQLIK